MEIHTLSQNWSQKDCWYKLEKSSISNEELIHIIAASIWNELAFARSWCARDPSCKRIRAYECRKWTCSCTIIGSQIVVLLRMARWLWCREYSMAFMLATWLSPLHLITLLSNDNLLASYCSRNTDPENAFLVLEDSIYLSHSHALGRATLS